MKAVCLEEVCDVIDYGVTASASAIPVGPKFLRITDIQDGSVEWDSVPYCNAAQKKLDASRLEPGDIVFARTGATTGKSFLIRDCPKDAVFASYLIRVRPGKEVDPLFLSFFFDSSGYWAQIQAKAQGAAQPGVNSTKLKSLQIPLPPLNDQRRIAAILDQADTLRGLRQRSIDRLNDLEQSIFYEMFGDPATNRKGWPMGTIRDLVREVKYGTSKKANTEGRGVPVLRMGNITMGGRLDLGDLKFVELSEKELSKYSVQKGDLLFNRTNSKELVGKTAVFNLSDDMAIAGYLVKARANEKANPFYISGYLNSKHGKATLRNMCKNIIGMANINAQEFQDIPIMIPPVSVQTKYHKMLESIDRERELAKDSVDKLNMLFSSLQQRAFSGEL